MATGPTLGDLLVVVGPGPRARAKHSHLNLVNLKAGQKRFIFHVFSTEPYSDEDGHLVSLLYPNLIDFSKLRLYPNLTPTNRRCRVFCSCPAFKYTGPAFLATRENYRLPEKKYIETRPAEVRDPLEHNYICKHVVRVGLELQKTTFPKLLRAAAPPRTAMHAQASLDRIMGSVRDYLEQHDCTAAQAQQYIAKLTPNNAEDLLTNLGMLCQSDDKKEP